MWKFIKVFIAGIAVSCYFFPFEFTFLPGVNTKMAMAGVGLVLYAIDLAKGRAPQISKDGLIIVILGLLVSLCGLLSVIVNNTNDYTYASYFVSMFVWLGGAFMAIKTLKWLYGYVSVELVCNHLVGVCVAQCIIALMIHYIPSFKSAIDAVVVGFDFVDINTLQKANRLYGIGAGLDVAGSRFAATLVIIAWMAHQQLIAGKETVARMYLIAFLIISVVGNMIARTTTVGVLMSLAYWGYASWVSRMHSIKTKIWKPLIGVLLLSLPIIIYYYISNREFHDSIRFAFEGFFSLVEQGRWETNSNNILKDMIVFPDNIKTWLIGDGYFDNPYWGDPYYTGDFVPGYYMGTDIGYIRFLFYFGFLGLITFMIYFVRVALACACYNPKFKTLFWVLLAINFIVWLKVSTDIFVVFALFLCVDIQRSELLNLDLQQ